MAVKTYDGNNVARALVIIIDGLYDTHLIAVDIDGTGGTKTADVVELDEVTKIRRK